MESVKKFGLIYGPDERMPWASNSCLNPTPMILDENIVRVFFGARDLHGVSRVGFVDLDLENPKKIISVSQRPALDVGRLGAFDDNGVVPCEVIFSHGKLYLFYAGFQLVKNIKFQCYTGLAVSENYGSTFKRVFETPVLDRSSEAMFIKTIHSIMPTSSGFKYWYSAGSSWVGNSNEQYAAYDIYCGEAESLEMLPLSRGKVAGINPLSGQYRIGRSRVTQLEDMYEMTYSYSCTDGRVGSGQAQSKDGVTWCRQDDKFPLTPSQEGWDSQYVLNPAYILRPGRKLYFYNGNNLGFDGFGCAEVRLN